MDRNYIRVDSLSFSSIEIYALGFLLLCFFHILYGKRNLSINTKLIFMYLLSLPFTDMVYRIGGMQISELIAVLMLFVNYTNKDIRVSKSYVVKYMFFFLVVLTISALYAINNTPEYLFVSQSQRVFSLMYCIKFFLHLYMVNRIILHVKEQSDFDSLIDVIRISGNITAVVTLLQVLLYKLGFVVPGIFEMWNIPRAKGLSHEPATNSFILLTILILTTFCFKGSIKLNWKSFFVQIAAFLICFSSGALVIFLAYMAIYAFMSIIKMRVTLQKVVIIHFLLPVLFMVGLYLALQTNFLEQISNVYDKVIALGSDYATGANVSGRGADIALVEIVKQSHPYMGLGAFNTLTFFQDLPLTNMYIVLYAELGLVGTIFLILGTIIFGAMMIRSYSKTRDYELSLNLVLFGLSSLLIIAWLRVLFFPQMWVMFGLFYAIGNFHISPQRVHNHNNIQLNSFAVK